MVASPRPGEARKQATPVERGEPGCFMLEMDEGAGGDCMSKGRPRTPEEIARELRDKLHRSAKRDKAATAPAARAGMLAVSHGRAPRPLGSVSPSHRPPRGATDCTNPWILQER